MKAIKFLLVGIFFGIVLVKSEAVSWYRIYEMFRFQSFHMYGIIGTAIASGILFLQISKKGYIKSIKGADIFVPKKDNGVTRYIIGGIIFGLGWALVGACPGPMYILLGTGVWSMLIVIGAAIAGTFLYGVLKSKLPH
ncbi:YeeE/YedE thiosulfate transporter family protein [Postechiella marina]|uniref:YeeE/YedE thiosulfate transporter family protein n=1 Tax=Postechiella marina TaxID=943941 RepID=A0ABP8BYG8_9FLAO